MSTKELSKQQQENIKQHVEKHVDKTLSKHLVSKAELLGYQFKQHVSTAIIAAFSFLIALAWKDLIVQATNSLIKEDLLQQTPYLPALIAAIVVTLIAIIGILIVTSWAKKPQVLVSQTETK
ncbi:MAG: hypothetical protein KJ600_00435 [Nanoarchaeota archaeon]|nr:hypothetical protein [Nanoarchaeota archaeon]MBU1103010.1 hypothetical protein [Nanoarchaeota archaeon]